MGYPFDRTFNPEVPGHFRSRLGQLRLYLGFNYTAIASTGDTAVDAGIASILDVPPLPYTTDDNAARTLLPSGWNWTTTADGAIGCARSSDQVRFGGGVTTDRDGNLVPDPLVRCLLAVEAHCLIAQEKHRATLRLSRED
ncbi:MAG TPA: hypothetical protein VNY53_03535 [Bradyrhizobium sp.]|jgi:hypothetical protein|nr:hypothetical protein [Bradyrhizobium sp.]